MVKGEKTIVKKNLNKKEGKKFEGVAKKAVISDLRKVKSNRKNSEVKSVNKGYILYIYEIFLFEKISV
jgi:hypothetical protein